LVELIRAGPRPAAVLRQRPWSGRRRLARERADAPYFPSADMPILGLSTVEISGTDGQAHLLRPEGFADDGVAAVALVDAHGSIIQRLPVTGNVYYDDAVPNNVTGLEALAADGQTLAQVP
jgi:hypothetical protein